MRIRKATAISVCMATYNGGRYVSEQVRSILSQLGADDELIVSDDHSTDNTIEIIEEFADPRIKIVYNATAKGYTRNFENAICNASGEIIFISDQDDVWLENKVEIMRTYLEHYDLVVSDARYVNHVLETTHGSHFQQSKMRSGFIRQAIRPCYIGACMAFRRSLLEMLLPFPKNAKYCAYDYWLTLIAESSFNVRLIGQELILYRRHDWNVSPAGKKSPNSFARKVLMRLYSLSALTLRVAVRSLSIESNCVSKENVGEQ